MPYHVREQKDINSALQTNILVILHIIKNKHKKERHTVRLLISF